MTARWSIAIVLAACAEPKLSCPDTSTASPGQPCSYPARAITIDGDLSDWDLDVPPPAATCTECACSTCTAGQVTRLRGTRTIDGGVALLVETVGPPRVDALASYLVSLFQLDGPSYGLSLRVTPSSLGMTVETSSASVAIDGLTASVAFASAASPAGTWGIELELPIGELPFGGGFAAAGELDVGAFGGRQPQVPTIGACWDATAPLCQPR